MMRATIANALSRLRALEGLRALRRVVRMPWLTVLTYHRVAPLGGPCGEMVDATPAQFERQIGLLAQDFSFIGVDELLAAERGKPLPPNPVMITFDDGYRDCFTTALPVLQRFGAKATFFVPTRYVEERRLFWWHVVALLVARCQRERIELSYPFPMVFVLPGNRRQVGEALNAIVKLHVGLDLDRFLADLARACDLQISRQEEVELTDELLMSWDDLRGLESAGMGIESHTRSHRVLHTLSPQQVRDELRGSRFDLQRQLAGPVRALSYPVGYPLTHLPHVDRALRDAGYLLAFTNHTGVHHTVGRTSPYDIRRIAMDIEYDDLFFRAMATLPYLAPRRRRSVTAATTRRPAGSYGEAATVNG